MFLDGRGGDRWDPVSGAGAAGAPEWIEHEFGFRVCGLPTHEFFDPYAHTFDFERVRILVEPPAR
ncbi:hypothetical protein ACBJ59_43215 [Nonomuraea sp. MTCD27]|uniref:hypothetical protein n=1 Tax=Nonomuraea sp. MTCD27 TaxID=1676747 RepID=UPI0035C0977E